jgi:serine/threonine protein kinase
VAPPTGPVPPIRPRIRWSGKIVEAAPDGDVRPDAGVEGHGEPGLCADGQGYPVRRSLAGDGGEDVAMRTLGGRYRLVQRIGIGGMSEVWRAHDRVLDRTVAIKIMAPAAEGLLGDTDGVEVIRTEARAAARLSHPNVASVHDFGTSKSPGRELPYIVMELVEGQTLGDHLANGPLDWRIGVRVCAEVAAALAAAHAENVVHRDIKPANIMLTPSGAKVLDFGIAAAVGTPDPDPEGPVMGTPAYVAPERFDGLPATPTTDMFSLGVLLFHCLSGRVPWRAATNTDLVTAQRYDKPDPLPDIDGMHPEIVDLYARCLDRDPGKRPTALVAALLLAESVDARVYVPMADPNPMPRPSSAPPWDERAAGQPTSDAGRPAPRQLPPTMLASRHGDDPAEWHPDYPGPE